MDSVLNKNNSDDRTGDSLKNKLQGALESQSVTGKKPSLVVIDEIDGASSGGHGEQVGLRQGGFWSRRMRLMLR